MKMKMLILYGTETGNTEMLAEDVAKHFSKKHALTLKNMSDATPQDLFGQDMVLLFSSSYGEGEPPASAKPFLAQLTAQKPNLKGVTFAIFGVGDQASYPATFGHGSKEIAHQLESCGAQQRGAHYVHDISSADFAEDVAIEWAETILANEV